MRDLLPVGHIPSFSAPPRASDALVPGSFAYHAFTQLSLDVQALFGVVPTFRGDHDAARVERLTAILLEAGIALTAIHDHKRGIHWLVETPVGPGRLQLRWTPRGLMAQAELLAEPGMDAAGAPQSIAATLQAWAAARFPLEESGTTWDWSDVLHSELSMGNGRRGGAR